MLLIIICDYYKKYYNCRMGQVAIWSVWNVGHLFTVVSRCGGIHLGAIAFKIMSGSLLLINCLSPGRWFYSKWRAYRPPHSLELALHNFISIWHRRFGMRHHWYPLELPAHNLIVWWYAWIYHNCLWKYEIRHSNGKMMIRNYYMFTIFQNLTNKQGKLD